MNAQLLNNKQKNVQNPERNNLILHEQLALRKLKELERINRKKKLKQRWEWLWLLPRALFRPVELHHEVKRNHDQHLQRPQVL